MTGRVLRLGVFIVIAFGLAVALGATIQGVSFDDRYELSATFDDVTGLFVGDAVKLAGVKVGQVTGIHLEGGRADVRFTVDQSVRLPLDQTTVTVRWRNLMGQRELYLDPGAQAGTADQFVATDGHGTIDRTSSAVDVGALLTALGPLGKAIEPTQLNDIFTALAEALNGNGPNIDNLIQNLNSVAAVVASRDQTIGQMLADYETVTDVLARRDEQIQTMIDNVTLLSQTFTDNTDLFLSAVDNMAAVGADVDQLLETNDQQLRDIVGNLAGLTDALNTKLPQLEQAFGGLPAALQALFSTVDGGNFLRIDATCFQFAAMPCNLLGGYWVP